MKTLKLKHKLMKTSWKTFSCYHLKNVMKYFGCKNRPFVKNLESDGQSLLSWKRSARDTQHKHKKTL